MRQELRPAGSRRGVHQDLHGGAARAGEARQLGRSQAESSGDPANLGHGVPKPVEIPDRYGSFLVLNAFFLRIIETR